VQKQPRARFRGPFALQLSVWPRTNARNFALVSHLAQTTNLITLKTKINVQVCSHIVVPFNVVKNKKSLSVNFEKGSK